MKMTAPKQYQQGWTEFYKLKFKLTPDVLIPRPETELIVDEVLKVVMGYELLVRKKGHKDTQSTTHGSLPITIIDVGTGSGCIAISMAKNNPTVKIIAIDISPAALEIAKKNSKSHQVDKRIFFVENDLLSGFKTAPDIIVANLPYIPSARLMLIDPMVRDFEPKIALDGGYDGFELYRKLLKQIKDQNITPKLFIGEIDDEQAEIAKVEAKRYFSEAQIEIKKDLAKKDRFLVVRF